MSFFAIFLALVLEQARPLGIDNPVYRAIEHWTGWMTRTLDAGVQHLAWVTWGMTTLTPALLALLVHGLVQHGLGWLAAVLWNVALLYVTLGFRQFSHHFTRIRDALDEGDEQKAREMLAQWQQARVGDIPRREILRHVIEYSVIAAHRHVFGVFFWYAALSVIGLGPAGAVVYRLAEYVDRRWQREQGADTGVSAVLAEVAHRAWLALDWLPARTTALGFAIVGSFEDAMDGWRNHAQKFPQDNDGVILAATAGAINVRRGGAGLQAGTPEDEGLQADQRAGSSTPGEPAQMGHLASVVGLVWRSVIMWLVLVALMTMANVLG
ncbi:MAG: CobD/CbiB family protein [Limnohabitans sp.]